MKSKYVDSMKRYEYKYLVTQDQYMQVLSLCQQQYEQVDLTNGNTVNKITNIYYDTPEDQLAKMSLNKEQSPVAIKEKVRIRAYGNINDQAPVFVELKQKADGVSLKNRVKMNLHYAEHFIETSDVNGIEYKGKQTQIQKLQAAFAKYHLQKKVIISYNRQSFVSADKKVRVTFDTQVEYCNPNKANVPIALLPSGKLLIEIKTDSENAKRLEQKMNEFGIQRNSFSKYKQFFCLENNIEYKHDISKVAVRGE